MRILLASLACVATVAAADDLVITPSNPTPLDTLRLRWTHVGCTNGDSIQVTQESNRITISTDRVFVVDCGTVNGNFEDFTIGRLPTGEYDVQLAVNPPPGSLGPTQLVGPLHFSVARLPATDAAAPHDDYSDLWWLPQRSGEALLLKQSSGSLFAVWAAYDSSGRATWYSLQPGAWSRNGSNVTSYSGPVYRTTGPWWGGSYDPNQVTITAVGHATFTPLPAQRAQFDVTIDGTTVTLGLQRMKF
jgi:hypothetical protein